MKTIPLSSLEADVQKTLRECADSGEAVVVELPDHRLIAIQALDPNEDDSLIDELIRTNSTFRQIIARSKASERKPFPTT
jgi:hypothetical protein